MSHPITVFPARAHNLMDMRDLKGSPPIQGYLAHQNPPHRRALQEDYLGSYSDPFGVGVFHERGAPVLIT